MNRKLIVFLASLTFLSSCEDSTKKAQLTMPISNNAVAMAYNKIDQEYLLYSFNGLGANKDWKAVKSDAFSFNLLTNQSKQIQPVPGSNGRLASIAATVNNQIYIFGGYTVAEDHSEISTPEVYRFDPISEEYKLITKMPTPVDDSVALVYLDRFIYLISGWHNDGNVSLVQILDTKDMSWYQGTPYPGAPVFGHAAGIVNNQMIISDGVKVLNIVDGKRHYGISDDNYLGKINPNDFTQIEWTKLTMHPGKARYRMASTGSKTLNKVIFVGGSDNPYNFNGIGYNGTPSEPNDLIFAYDFTANNWQELGIQKTPSMDHRGLLEFNDKFYILGGILSKQKTTNKIQEIQLEN